MMMMKLKYYRDFEKFFEANGYGSGSDSGSESLEQQISNTKKANSEFLKEYTNILKQIKIANRKNVLTDKIKSGVSNEIKKLLDKYKDSKIYPIDLDSFKSDLKNRYLKEHELALAIITTDKSIDKTKVVTKDKEAISNGTEVLKSGSGSSSNDINTNISNNNIINVSKITEPKYKALIDKILSEKKAELLKPGTISEYVELIQYICVKLNGSDIEIDKKFGKNTLGAVKSLQTRLGLNPDGTVGKDTWTKLLGSDSEIKIFTTPRPRPISSVKKTSDQTSYKSNKIDTDMDTNISTGSGSGSESELLELTKSKYPDFSSDEISNDINKFYHDYATDTFSDFDESGWLDIFKNSSSKSLLRFITNYNKVSGYNFVKDSKEAFDSDEMKELSDILKSKNIKL